MKIDYRQGKNVDLEQVMDLLKSVDGDRNELKIEDFLVAVDGQKIIGSVRLKKMDDDNLELASLAVLLEYRDKHIGSELIRKITENRKENVYIMCFRKNLGFYLKNNFEEIGVDKLPKILEDEYFKVINIFKNKDEIIIMKLKNK